MKKTLFVVAVAAIAMTACTNEKNEYVGENNNSPKEIAFRPLTQSMTRGAIYGTAFPTANSFFVAAYKVADDNELWFGKTEFTFVTSSDPAVWTGTTHQYWPMKASTLNFFSVAAADVNANHITLETGDPASLTASLVAYTSGNNYSSATQSDIMYASGRASVTAGTNSLTFPDHVNMVFNHALSQIKFYVKGVGDGIGNIVIKSIKVNGAKYTGTLNFTLLNFDNSSSDLSVTPAWTPDTYTDNVVVPNFTTSSEDNYTLTSSYYPADNSSNLLIIPATTGAWTNFVIEYSVGEKDYTYTYTPTAPVAAAAGTVYVFSISMALHEIKVHATTTDWTPSEVTPSI